MGTRPRKWYFTEDSPEREEEISGLGRHAGSARVRKAYEQQAGELFGGKDQRIARRASKIGTNVGSIVDGRARDVARLDASFDLQWLCAMTLCTI